MLRTANWIWKKQEDYTEYNSVIEGYKTFQVNEMPDEANIAICADTMYRLYINNHYVGDGPARFYPSHVKYDVIDVMEFLKKGNNEIKIIADFWGCNATTRLQSQAGFIASLTMDNCIVVATDDTWLVRKSHWVDETPLTSFSQGPYELCDLTRREEDYENAVILSKYDNGPWKNLMERDCPMLSMTPLTFTLDSSRELDDYGKSYTFPFKRSIHDNLNQEDNIIPTAGSICTEIYVNKDQKIKFSTFLLDTYVDGKKQENEMILTKGWHLILWISTVPYHFQSDDPWFLLQEADNIEIRNPVDHTSDFCFISPQCCQETLCINNHSCFKNSIEEALKDKIMKGLENIKRVSDKEQLMALKSDENYIFKDHINPLYDPYPLFHAGLSEEKGKEYIYDLKTQSIGYIDLEIEASQKGKIDVYLVEYIREDGVIQHTTQGETFYRNGFSLIVDEDVTTFTSLKRRSGRYAIVRVYGDINIKSIVMKESVYPVKNRALFKTSNEDMNKIWDMSMRTLELCMEDTFTDCPLYEQNCWVGDMRNEALFAYTAFGAHDLAKRTISLAAESLEIQDLVAACVPSYSVPATIPVWSFLWNIAIKEYYLYSRDLDYIKEIWPDFKLNLENTQKYINKEGLFEAEFWNMFDWGDVDWQGRSTMLFNSIMIGAALEDGIYLADLIDDLEFKSYCMNYKAELVNSVNSYYSEGSYPDNTDNLSSRSIITLAVAYLYGFCDEPERLIKDTDQLNKIGSPFSLQYLYEAYEKANYHTLIIDEIVETYTLMIEAGSTTVWEVLPGTSYGPADFPTRSHTHAWSSTPIYFFTRIILGVKLSDNGYGYEYEVSPIPCNLTYAQGEVVTKMGNIKVEWRIEDNIIYIHYEAPPECTIKVVTNDWIEKYEMIVE